MSAKKTLTVTIEENTAATAKAEDIKRKIAWCRETAANPAGFESGGKLYTSKELLDYAKTLEADPVNISVLAAANAAKNRMKRITVKIDNDLTGKLDEAAAIGGIARDVIILKLLAKKMQMEKRAA